MRERDGLSMMTVVVMVVVMMAVGTVKDTTATPVLNTLHHHQELSSPISMQANHVEDEYLDNALDEWLNNFDTYTFMVKQDLDIHGEEEGEGGEEENEEIATEEQEEVEDEAREEEWSAPIAVSVGSKSLLDPHLDYLVTVESLVAEEGSIFLTLSKYYNQTECGVGGLTVEAAMRSTPRRAGGRSGGGLMGVAQDGSSSNNGEHHNFSTTFIAFGLQNEGNITLPDTSAWAEVSEDYWWARGRLAGGGMLSITFTPPECGCLALSTYYALPVGNLTLVVGPQAYPDELQILLCIDPLAVAPVHEEYDEEEEEQEEEEEVGEYLQEPSALVAPRNTGEGETETEAEVQEIPEEPPVTPRRRKMSRGGKRRAKKTRRQMKRQRIRQAGRRQARRQQRQQQRQEDEEVEEGEVEFKRTRRRWKQKRKGKKAWRKIKKHGRKGRRRFHGAKHHHGHHEEGVNGTSPENMTDHQHHQHHHHPYHHHPFHGYNTTAAHQQEERLIDILLRDLPAENSTSEEQEKEATGEGSTTGEEGVGEEGGEEEEEEALTPRERRKNRRQRKKMMRKERKKAHPPGVKFCCKQGVKHKKNILEFNSTSEDSPEPCNSTSEVVSTFANHQFGIEVNACDNTYTTCCTKFTAKMWDAIKVKKTARRMERKQRRKSRRLDRKHRRQNVRRMRKEMIRQSRHQDEAEEDPEANIEWEGKGDVVVE